MKEKRYDVAGFVVPTSISVKETLDVIKFVELQVSLKEWALPTLKSQHCSCDWSQKSSKLKATFFIISNTKVLLSTLGWKITILQDFFLYLQRNKIKFLTGKLFRVIDTLNQTQFYLHDRNHIYTRRSRNSIKPPQEVVRFLRILSSSFGIYVLILLPFPIFEDLKALSGPWKAEF